MNALAVWIGVALVALVAIFLVLRSPSEETADATVASKEETAWNMVDHGALLVDVRTQEEFDAGHIEGALLIPHDQVAARLAEFGEDTHRPVVVYCRSGHRAGLAQTTLEENGFTRVFNGGGYEALKTWREAHPKEGE
ncbi:MAG: rhodanese-like domain-containing protein [Alphaproteobacteria bacterium]|nr:MAG: rhodanese-like domain-containing protein [Alphaproteobacteria bacterium]